MTYFFTGDTHFGCDNLIKNIRPTFNSTDEHDQTLIDNINRDVGRNDTLVILGDFSKEKPGKYRQQINCKHIFFILGNHDNENKIRNVFGGNVWYQKYIKLSNGEYVLCFHHPICFWHKSHGYEGGKKGALHCYGHTHANEKYEAMMDLGLPERRSLDVGVDNAFKLLGEYRPFSEFEIIDLIGSRSGHDIIPLEQQWASKDYGNES